jgi:hypothetical protein
LRAKRAVLLLGNRLARQNGFAGHDDGRR